MQKTPSEQGYAMPAEWERHAATWLVWPHDTRDWPGKFFAIPWAYAEIVRRLTPGERVNVLVQSARQEASARRILAKAGVDPAAVTYVRQPTNRGWARDFGPTFVRRSAPRPGVAALIYKFTAWARYSDWDRDAKVSRAVARRLKIDAFDVRLGSRPIVLEGGALDVNGSGTLVATEASLLNQSVQVRNPGLGREDMQQVFRDYFGAPNVWWLGRGIAGDDTHGHVDDLCRFVSRDTVVICREKNTADMNHAALEDNAERMQDMRLEDGARPQVVMLPMPGPLYFGARRLPATYANFYIANAAVLVPTFNDPNDRVALGILGELFRDRPVIGIHAVDLVCGGGTLHCLTQQQPGGGDAER